MTMVYAFRNVVSHPDLDEWYFVAEDADDLNEMEEGEEISTQPQPDCCGAGILTIHRVRGRQGGIFVKCSPNEDISDSGCGHLFPVTLRDDSKVII